MTKQDLINQLNDLCAKAREVAHARVWAQMSPEAPDADARMRHTVAAERRVVESILEQFPHEENRYSSLEAVLAWRRAVAKTALPWEPDESVPPRYVRRLASTGQVLATVDPHVGGYARDVFNPSLIAYRAQVGNHTEYGILNVVRHGEHPEPENTISAAKDILDDFLSNKGITLL